jgi:PAS domain S-box-containing protein
MAAPSNARTACLKLIAQDAEELRARLTDAEDTLRAIRTGEIDAVVVNSDSGPKVYTLEGADRPYRVMVERIHEGAVTVDGDEYILYSNPRFAAMVGTGDGTVGGSRFSRFIPESEAAFYAALTETARETGHSSGELDLLTSAGDRFPVRLSLATLEVADGRTLCILATDLREHRRMEQAVRQRDREIGTLLDNTPDVIMRQDAGFRYTYVNAATANIAGIAPEDFIGKTSADLGLPEDLISLWNDQKLSTIETRQLTTAEFSYPSPHGVIELEQRVIPEFAADGSVESLLIIGRDVTERKRLEKVAASRHQEVQALAANLLTVQEDERRRVSRELHDQICQDLASLAVDLGEYAANPPLRRDAVRRFKALQARVVKAAEEARHISYGLHPSVLDDLGVVASIRKLCREISAEGGVPVEFTDGEMPRSIPRELAACLYRVAQQSLQNAARHAHAPHISVTLGVRKGTVGLAIKDDGAGFDREAVRGAGGLGLVGMAERARLAKGKLTIATQPGKGTRILLELPLPGH